MEIAGTLYFIGGVIGIASIGCAISSYHAKCEISKYSKFRPLEIDQTQDGYLVKSLGDVYLEGLLYSDNPIQLKIGENIHELINYNINSYDHIKWHKTSFDYKNKKSDSKMSANSGWVYDIVYKKSKYDYSKLFIKGVDVTNLHSLFERTFIATYYTNNLHIPYSCPSNRITSDSNSLHVSMISDCHIYKQSEDLYGIPNKKSFFTVAGFFNGNKFDQDSLVITEQLSSYINKLEDKENNYALVGIILGVLACCTLSGGVFFHQKRN